MNNGPIELKFSPDVPLNFSVLGMDRNIGPPRGGPLLGGPPIELKFSPDVPLNYWVKGMDPNIGPPRGGPRLGGPNAKNPI